MNSVMMLPKKSQYYVDQVKQELFGMMEKVKAECQGEVSELHVYV